MIFGVFGLGVFTGWQLVYKPTIDDFLKDWDSEIAAERKLYKEHTPFPVRR